MRNMEQVEVDVVAFLKQTAAVLGELLDRTTALERRVAAIEDVNVLNDKTVAAAVIELGQRVTALETGMETSADTSRQIDEIARDLRGMNEKLQVIYSRTLARRAPRDSSVN